jgi:hypothetical protein
MEEVKRKRLEQAGWKSGTVSEFLELTPIIRPLIKRSCLSILSISSILGFAGHCFFSYYPL